MMKATMNQTTTFTNDITTRLLAQENLLIERAPVRTASFDVKNRILVLPMWQNMTPEIEEMLKAHEVGHALYTDESMFAQYRESDVPFSYFNIIEDVRIERLMKSKYPGLRRAFTKGYKELLDMNFFGTESRDLNALPFADRINLYFKAGYDCGVRFSAAEKFLLDQVSRVESIDQVAELSRKIYEFSKKQAKEKQERLMNDDEFKKVFVEIKKEEDELAELDALDAQDNDDYDDYYGDDEDDDRSEEQKAQEEEQQQQEEEREAKTGRGGGTTDKNISTEDANPADYMPTTNTAFEEKVALLADTSTKYTYLNLPNTGKFANQIIIPFKRILRDNAQGLESRLTYLENKGYGHHADRVRNANEVAMKDYDKFQFETTKVVSYLVKEFEMKKAATDYKRIQVSKTGVLDPRKLASYKIREDLFKQITITKDGQKHGMIFVLDWSGSMNDYLPETVKQLISLVQFCYRVKIPFQVFAFTDRMELLADNPYPKTEEGEQHTFNKLKDMELKIYGKGQGNLLGLSNRFGMLEFFNDKMKPSELNQMCKTLYLMAHSICDENYMTNGTPLNEALVFMYDYIGEFMSKNQVEKFTLIKLTDGDGGNCNYYQNTDSEEEYRGYGSSYIEDFSYDGNKRVRHQFYIRDNYTKKNYSLTRNETVWGNVLTQMIRDRYNCGTIGFHVTKSGGRDIGYAIKTYGLGTGATDVVAIKRDMIKEQFAAINVYGHDELFLLRANMKISEETLKEDMTNMTAAAIAKNFTKHLSAKKTSRVLLNRFVGVVA
jgi:Mg-chelatase subunit ChlD